MRRRKDGVGTRGFGESGVAIAIENETGVEVGVEVEDQRRRRMTRKVGRKGLTHLQMQRRCWIGSVGQSCCGSQRRMGT